jgi:hypothetical protein
VRRPPLGVRLRRTGRPAGLDDECECRRVADQAQYFVGRCANLVVTRELILKGAFRFDHEFDDALSLLA